MPKMKIKSHSQPVITPPENNMCSQTMLRTFNNPFVFCFCQHWLFSPNAFYRLDVFIAHTWDWPTGHVHTTMHGGIWESPISVFSWRGWVSENDLVLSKSWRGETGSRNKRRLSLLSDLQSPDTTPSRSSPRAPPVSARAAPARRLPLAPRSPRAPGRLARGGPPPPAPPARPRRPPGGPSARAALPPPAAAAAPPTREGRRGGGWGGSVLRGTKRTLPFWDAAGPRGGSGGGGRALPLLWGCALTFPVVHGGGGGGSGPCSPDGWRPRQPGGGFSQWRLPPQRGEAGPARGSTAIGPGAASREQAELQGEGARDRQGRRVKPSRRVPTSAASRGRLRGGGHVGPWQPPFCALASGPVMLEAAPGLEIGETSTPSLSHTHPLGPWWSGHCRKHSPQCTSTRICPYAELEVR